MPARFLTPQTKQAAIDRIRRIGSDTPRRWGKMTAGEMIAHLTRSVEVSLGEVQMPDRSNFFSRNVMRVVGFHVMTDWPKGRIQTMPGYLVEPGANYDAEREKLIASVERFIGASEAEPSRMIPHPMFGPVTLEYWRRIHGTHFEHHFKQFGV